MRPAYPIIFGGFNIAQFLGAKPGAWFDFTKQPLGAVASITSEGPGTETATQATGGQQPVVTAGSPNFANFDGLDDGLQCATLIPGSEGCIAACFRHNTTAGGLAIGSNAAGANRCYLGLSVTTSTLFGNWNATNLVAPTSSLGLDNVGLFRWQGNGALCELWTPAGLVARVTGLSAITNTNPFGLGQISSGGGYLSGRIYRAGIRSTWLPDQLITPTLRALSKGIL